MFLRAKQEDRNHLLSYSVIFVCLFIALCPAILSDNYLRQDDLKTGIWWGMSMPQEGFLYYNTVFQLVRPICMVLFYLTDLASINMHYAVYVRLISILAVALSAILLYRWQLLFNSHRLLAVTFAISAFTLPGMQLFVATANYLLIIIGVLLTIGGALCWHMAYSAHNLMRKRWYYSMGC